MLYSRAIRQGLPGTTKAIGVFYRKDADGQVDQLCVQGAALRGIGQLSTDALAINQAINNAELVRHYFHYTEEARVPYTRIPERAMHAISEWTIKGGMVQLLDASINMNNDTNMTREEIADWVEEMEREFVDPDILCRAELAVH